MPLRHDPDRDGWTIETENLSGFLLPTGARHGIKTLVHQPTGIDVVHPDYDVLNLFFMFSTNLCMGQARALERTVTRDGDSLVVRFEATDEHRAELIARYTVVEREDAVDLSITVKSGWPYPAYELFLSNYFPPPFRPHVYVEGCPYTAGAGEDEWIAPDVNDVFAGTGLVFPRDQHVSGRSVDGRWTRIGALYQWNPQRYYAAPVAYQADPAHQVAAVLMSRPEDCFAVISGYDSPNMDDPFASQNPLYLSLFGDDLLPGDERTVAVRLAVCALDEVVDQPLARYEKLVAGSE